MKKYTLICCLFLIANSLFSQLNTDDIKFKKNILLINGEETLYLEKYKDNNEDAFRALSFKTLSGKELFRTACFSESVDGYVNDLFLRLDDGKITNEINVENKDLNLFKYKVSLVSFLANKFQFFNEEGINEEKIELFFSKQLEREDRYADRRQKANQKKQNYEAIKPKATETYDEALGYTIISNVTNEPIGYYKVVPYSSGDYKSYGIEIFDLDGIRNMTILPNTTKGSMFTHIDTFNGKKISLPLNGPSYTVKNPTSYVDELLKEITKEGYTLGHQATEFSQYKKEKKAGEIQELKDNSVNIYSKKGYLIDEKGERYEGEITIPFEYIEHPDDSNSGMVDTKESKAGQEVYVAYLNTKGKKKSKTFVSKKGVRFCIEETGKCYKGLGIKGQGAALAAGGLSSLNFDTSFFYEEIYLGKNISIYHDITSSKDRYVIWSHKEKKGLEVNPSNLLANAEKTDVKNREKLTEYLSTCSKIKEEIQEIDLNSKQDLLNLVKKFDNCN